MYAIQAWGFCKGVRDPDLKLMLDMLNTVEDRHSRSNCDNLTDMKGRCRKRFSNASRRLDMLT